MKRTGIKRGKPPKRKTPLRQRGQKYTVNRLRDFGPHADNVRKMPCLVCGKKPSDPHHEPPRSLGGKAKNLVPLCRKHHRHRHALGSASMFFHYYHIDLYAAALEIWEAAQ